MESPVRVAVLGAWLVAALAACGGAAPVASRVAMAADVASPVVACDPGACGPPLGLPNGVCPDGVHVSGPGDCVALRSGGCGWQIWTCDAFDACVEARCPPAPPLCGPGQEAACGATVSGCVWACVPLAAP